MATPHRSSARNRSTPSRSASSRSATSRSAPSRSAPEHEDGSAPHRSSARALPAKKGSGIGLYVTVGIGVIILIAIFSIGPIRKNMALNTLDSFKNDGKNPEAIAAADAYLALAGDQPSVVASAIRQDRGPVTAQIHLAKQLKLFTILMFIAERPLKSGEGAGITVEERVSALETGAEIYDTDKNGDDLLPDDIKKWAQAIEQDRSVALASIKLLVVAKPKYINELLTDIATKGDPDPVLANAAIDGLASLAEPSTLGYIIKLLEGNNNDLVIANKALTERIINLANGDHLTQINNLLDHPKPGVRAIAFEALGGPLMRLGDSPAHVKLRSDLAKKIGPKLVSETPSIELAATLKAVRGLRLLDTADAVLALLPQIPGLMLPEIDNEVMADILGRALIPTIDLPPPPKDGGKPTEQDLVAIKIRAQGDALITKLSAGLDDGATRTVCAMALSLIRDKTYLPLRDAVDRLIAHGEEPTCMNAVITIVDKTYGRNDVTKQCQLDLNKWEKFLKADRPQFERVKEILEWLRENGKYQLVSDGRERLGISKDYLTAAQAELDSWLSDPKFLPPLGLTRGRIDGLNQDIKMLGMNVRKAWSGAL